MSTCHIATVFAVVKVWISQLDHKGWVQKDWCFWTVVLEKTRVPWTARSSNQSILKKISPESLELMLKLKVELKDTPWKESYDQPRQHTKKQRHYFAKKCLSSQGYGFFSSHVWMWELDYKESWVLKNWCFWTVVLEKTLENPLDCKEIKPVHPKGDQFWVFIWRTDVEAETTILWPPDVKNWLIWKDPDAGKDWARDEKGMREDEMAGWHHWLKGLEFW